MFLTVSGLTKIYGDKKVVDNVSFEAEKGSITCILGPSGSGKTTILRCLGGFENPESGNVIIDNREILSLSPEERPISTVFQSYGLFPHKSVIENTIYGLKFKKVTRKEAIKEGQEILEIVGLKGYDNRRINQLSGGEQQRVALARSLVVKPNLLLLDEPFSNLDAKLKLVMREEIQKIQKTFNITTIFVTHDQEDAFSVADQIILMNKGRIEQISSPMDIYNYPKGEFPLQFIGRSNIKSTNEKVEFVRPEEIKLHDNPKENTMEGIIEKRVFKGAIVEYHISTKDANLIAIELSKDKVYNEGSIVYLEFEYKVIM
ncbi:ABC transporter ATP-binding protein [Tissierella pigra]|uniref:ABC-type quaternary amine transporter n=1 Tax=Tissierella pigra TaxID=2607614 RepID=A0A6N7XQB4_9FIRM|nr:ABC transporter ATP-binding protein [Tissierella pigra]MSU02992.1 ABC transporter ATP-binding protein [Tissierella pigra]